MVQYARKKSKNEIYGLYCKCDACELKHPQKVRYVGQTSTGSASRFSHHKYLAMTGADYPVCRWIRKHGVENIETVVLERVWSPDQLDMSEVRWIDKMETLVEFGGLNLWPGGKSVRGYKHRPDAKSRAKGRKRSPETLRKMSEASSKRTGEKGGNHKITESTAVEIKKLLWAGATTRAVSEELGVSKCIVQGISSGAAWKDTPWPIGPRHRKSDGRFASGVQTQAKITEDDVRNIRAQYSGGQTYKQIADRYNMTDANISMIVRRVTWKDVI